MNLDGRVALVTGGAGRIGLAIAETLAEQGCHLALLDRSMPALRSQCMALSARWGVKVEPIEVDLERETARDAVPDTVSRLFGRLDILVNNAAFVGDTSLDGWVTGFDDQSLLTWRRCVEVNVTAAFHLCQLLAPKLRAAPTASIVNIASIYGAVGPDYSLYENTSMGNPAAYAISKAGLLQLTRWLATTLAPDVRVNCISPGGVARGQPQSFVDRYVKRTPLARMGKEEDFKGAIAYLASDLSAWVTGQNLFVDGGWTVW